MRAEGRDEGSGVGYTIARVPAAATFELRHEVLRPHQSLEEMALPDDDLPSTASFAALDHEGAVLATVRVALAARPAALRELGPADGDWQLRGMATRPDRRGQGIGGAVLGRAVAHVAEAGGGLLWCNARVPAVSLYRRAAFAVAGDEWVEAEIGPHVLMWRRVSPATQAVAVDEVPRD